MHTIPPKEAKRLIRDFKRKLELHGEDVNFLNIVAMMDMMSILLVFLLKNWSVSAANVQLAEVEPPVSSIRLPVAEALKVQITPTAVIVDGEQVVPVRGGKVAPNYKKTGDADYEIVPLLDVVEKHAKREKKISQMQGEEWRGELSVIADKKTPFRLISEVVYTVGLAGYSNYRLVTLAPEE